jgi:hypothetical protein
MAPRLPIRSFASALPQKPSFRCRYLCWSSRVSCRSTIHLHTLAPEVWFDNPWESSNPVRIVNLLEHTTGWDDLHFREYAKQAPDSMSLREGLDYDHHSRTSRWPPGTRMAYCNAGPAAAAYVVEKLTGQRFEDFVQQHLFMLFVLASRFISGETVPSDEKQKNRVTDPSHVSEPPCNS